MRTFYLLSLFEFAVMMALGGVNDDNGLAKPKQVEAVIQWPSVVVERKKEEPAPVSNKLTAGVLLDVKCLAPCRVRAFPPTAVTITQETVEPGETFSLRGSFIDGSKSKRWKGPCTVYLLEAASTADGVIVEIIPYGFKDDSQVLTKTIDTNVGPRPPPVEPDPVEPVVKKASRVTVVICEDPLKRTVADAAVINDTGFRDFVKITGGSVEVLTVKDPVYVANNFKSYAEKVGLPAVLVFDADATGPSAPLSFFKLPNTPSAAITEVGKVVKK